MSLRDLYLSCFGRAKRQCLLSLAVLLSACATAPKNEPPVAVPENVVTTPATTASTAAAPELPAEAQQQFDKALSLLKAGQGTAAAQQLQQLASTYPTATGPLINLGLIELKAGRHEQAATFFKSALQRDAKSVAANNYLGVSYRNLGRFQDAEAAYQAAIAADDTYAAAHLNLGILYDLYLQKPEQALSEYQRYQSLQAQPDAKAANWIKELTARVNADKKAKSAAGGATP
ncbi:MAG: tetratricopeptide repeat protein [Steroidobacteraceae bacterium]